MRDIVLFLEVPDSGIWAMYYKAARSLDLLPVLVGSYPLGRGGLSTSDYLQAARMDVTGVLSAIDRIGRERIAGVFASASARAELAARVAAALDRRHADPDAISLCNDKYRLRKFLADQGLNTVAYHHVATASDALSAAKRLGGAVVVKPLSSSGSDGVRICRTTDEAVLHATRLLKRKSEGVLIEKYIDAPQFSVELFDGKALNVKRSYAAPGPFPIMIGHDAPASLQREHLAEIKNYASSVVKEVGISSGPSAVQLRDSGTEKYIIEINPRPSLNGPIEIGVATGIDLAALCLKICGELPYEHELFVSRKNRVCATRFIVRNGSSVRAIKGLEEARKFPGIKSIYLNESQFYRRGPETCAHDRIAVVHSEADTIELAAANADTAMNKLVVVYDKFPIDLIKFYARRVRRLWEKLSIKCRSLTNQDAKVRLPEASRGGKALAE